MFEIWMCSPGGVTYLFSAADTLSEALEIGHSYGWQFTDENGFVWDLYLEEN